MNSLIPLFVIILCQINNSINAFVSPLAASPLKGRKESYTKTISTITESTITSSQRKNNHHRNTVTGGTQLNLIPLSSLTKPNHKSFLSSSDSYRICIDANGYFHTTNNKESNNNDNTTNTKININTTNHESEKQSQDYKLCLAQEDDLPSIASFTIDAFGGADVINLSNDLNSIEKTLIQPGISLLNEYANVVAFTDVLSGLRKRLYGISSSSSSNSSTNDNGGEKNEDEINNEIVKPSIIDDMKSSNLSLKEIEEIASQSSVILVLTKEPSSQDDNDSSRIKDKSDIIATVEIRLQPTDAKIPFTQPWFDKLERKVASLFFSLSNDPNNNQNAQPAIISLQPYLSNLCVDTNYRGRNIGKALCRAVECIVGDTWGYSMIYLHVDLENVAALKLYEKEGYVDVGMRWNPFWAGKAADIGYFVKQL